MYKAIIAMKAAAIILLLLAGCVTGSKRGAVGLGNAGTSGGITIKGKPITPPVWPIEPTPGQPVSVGGQPELYWVHRVDLCAFSVVFNDVQYSIDVSCQNKDIVLYVQTSDKKFRSPEGLSTASNMRVALDVGGTLLLGNKCEVRLPSGWTAHPNIDMPQYAKTAEECSVALDKSIQYFNKHTNKEGSE
jgi:hypothetical protein